MNPLRQRVISLHTPKIREIIKKKLKISPKIVKKQVQEDPGLDKRGDGGKVGLHSSKQKKKKLKNDFTSSSMEL